MAKVKLLRNPSEEQRKNAGLPAGHIEGKELEVSEKLVSGLVAAGLAVSLDPPKVVPAPAPVLTGAAPVAEVKTASPVKADEPVNKKK